MSYKKILIEYKRILLYSLKNHDSLDWIPQDIFLLFKILDRIPHDFLLKKSLLKFIEILIEYTL